MLNNSNKSMKQFWISKISRRNQGNFCQRYNLHLMNQHWKIMRKRKKWSQKRRINQRKISTRCMSLSYCKPNTERIKVVMCSLQFKVVNQILIILLISKYMMLRIQRNMRRLRSKIYNNLSSKWKKIRKRINLQQTSLNLKIWKRRIRWVCICK